MVTKLSGDSIRASREVKQERGAGWVPYDPANMLVGGQRHRLRGMLFWIWLPVQIAVFAARWIRS